MAVARFLLDGVEVALDCVLDSAYAGVDDGQDVVHLRGPFLRLYRLQDLKGREVSVQADEGDGGVVVLIWAEEGDRCVVVHIGEGLEAAGVGAVHCGGVDGVLDHTLSVQVEVELHRTQLRVDLLLCVRVQPYYICGRKSEGWRDLRMTLRRKKHPRLRPGIKKIGNKRAPATRNQRENLRIFLRIL